MTTGEYLKKSREKAKLSQGDLAKLLGYKTTQFVSNMERGVSLPPKNILDKLCLHLKVNKRKLVNLILNDIAKDYLK